MRPVFGIGPLGACRLAGSAFSRKFSFGDRRALQIAREAHQLALQAPDRHLALLVADLHVIDRHVVGHPGDALLLGRQQARQPAGDCPRPTRTTPGLPTARCTTSKFLLAATAGVTVQPPRMLCRIAAAAPGWPSIVAYWADCANRPKTIIAAIRPASTPNGREQRNQAGEEPDDHEHGDHAHGDERDNGQGPGIGLADHARRHPELLNAAETGRIHRVLPVFRARGLIHHGGQDTRASRQDETGAACGAARWARASA